MSSTNRTRWRTQRNFSKLSLSNGSVLLGSKMPDWVLGLFCFWHHPDPWSTVMIPVFCVCLWRLLYICDIIPDPYIHFFSSLVQFRVNHQPIAGIAHRDREPFMLPFVATTYLESSVILTRMSLDCGGSHACTGRLHTPKCPSELVDSNPDPSCCEVMMLSRSFPEKKVLLPMFECLGWCNRTIHPSVLTAYQLHDHRELAWQEMSLHFTPCFGSTQMPPVDKPLQRFNNKMPTLRTLSANVQQVTFTIIFAILFHQFSMLTLAI